MKTIHICITYAFIAVCLHLSAMKPSTVNDKMAKLLIACSDTQVNLQDGRGFTPLMMAVHEGHPDIVKLLLAHPKIQVDMQNNDGLTALDIAKARNHVEIINLLQSYNDTEQQGGLEEDNYSRLSKCRCVLL